MIKQLWRDQADFIKQNYSEKGVKFCASSLNLSDLQVMKRATRLGVTLNKHDYLNDFLPFSPKSVYTLGFISGDGHISSKTNAITIEFKTEDAEDIDNILMFTPWKKYYRQREHWKQTTSYHICNDILNKWLRDFGFVNKSYIMPSIVNIIPEDLLHYFLLGLFDADGNINVRKIYRKHYGKLSISSTKEYLWDDLLSIYEDKIGVKFLIYRTSHCSTINLSDRESVFKFYDYLYQNYDKDQIGMTRKHDKFGLIDLPELTKSNFPPRSRT